MADESGQKVDRILVRDKHHEIQQQFSLQIEAFKATELNIRQEIQSKISLLDYDDWLIMKFLIFFPNLLTVQALFDNFQANNVRQENRREDRLHNYNRYFSDQ